MIFKKGAELKEEPKVKAGVSRITIKGDCGFPNNFFIRGSGAGLNWTKGLLLKNLKKDEWVWESKTPFDRIEFKILINDEKYELGENHPLKHGEQITLSPKF